MDLKEYEEAILRIVVDGRGYKAIMDITHLLQRRSENTEKVLMEYKSESKAIKKYCNADNMTNKAIVNVIKTLIDKESDNNENRADL